MSVFSNIINGVREAAMQSTAIVTSSSGFQTVKAAGTSATVTSAAIGGKKAAFKVGHALGRASKALAYSLRSNFVTSLVVLEVADAVERFVSKRQIKKEMRELSDILARTVPVDNEAAQIRRENDVKRLLLLEDMLPKRRSFKRFLKDLPQRIIRRVVRAVKTAIGSTGVVWTAPIALASFLVDFVWRVGVIVPVKAYRTYKGKSLDVAKWTKYTGAVLNHGIRPFFFFMRILVDGVTLRTWLEPKDVTVLEELFTDLDMSKMTFTDIECADAYKMGYESMVEYRHTQPKNSVLLYGLLLRTAAERHTHHGWLFSYSEGVRDATPWMFRDLATAA